MMCKQITWMNKSATMETVKNTIKCQDANKRQLSCPTHHRDAGENGRNTLKYNTVQQKTTDVMNEEG